MNIFIAFCCGAIAFWLTSMVVRAYQDWKDEHKDMLYYSRKPKSTVGYFQELPEDDGAWRPSGE